MPSLKRPSSSYVASSQRASSSAAASTSRLQKTRRLLPESEDLFCSSDDDNQSLQSKKSPQKSQKSTKYQDESLFSKIMTGAGLVLQTGDLPNVLSCDQAKFQRSVIKALNCGSLLSSSNTSCAAQATTEVTQVLSGLEAYLKLPLRLKWSLLYTETDPACEVANRGNQDSLIRLLLNVDALQPSLVTLLTDTLLTLAYEQNDGENSNLPALLLGNLRWLDHVVEPEKLSDAVLLVLQAATTEVQKEIIAFLPNIVTDQFHPATADALTELYSQTPALVPAILDALLHLTLDEDSLEEVHHTVLKTLHAAQPHHLPCVLRFLLHNTNSGLAFQVLSDVREKLHIPSERDMLPPPPPSQRSLAPRTVSNNASENADLGVLIFSTIKMALLLHKYLTNAWLKAIDDVEYSSTRNVDLLLLVLVHDAVPSRRRAVHSILRNKIRTGLQYDALLRNTLADNPAVMREYFDSIKKLAGMMIRSPEPAFCQFGVTLYSVVFEVSSGGLQQEVVVALLAHLGDDQHVRLAALTLLASLAHQHTHAMARFAIFLKSSLEQLERLSLQESRCLLDAVSAVAASDPDTALHADLAIHTRKLLNHGDIRYKRLGVLSAVLTLKNSHDPNASTSSSNGSGVSLTGAGCGEDVLEVVWACTSHSPPASALFMDELASTILRDGINTRLERWLSSKLEEGFESVFIQDLESDTPPLVTRHTDLQLDLAFDLEVEEQAVIALNLGVLVEKLEAHRREEKTNTRSVAEDSLSSGSAATQQDTILLTLAPHFRLLRMLVSHLNAGELSAIDGLLGCPIYYPKKELLVPDTFAKLSKEKQSVLLSCLFFAANWFRELVNAFVTQKTQELKKKVYSRLRNLLEVEQSLSMLLPLSPSYCPHLAASHIDPAAAPPPPPAAAAPAAGTTKRGRKPKAKKKSKSSTTAADASTLGLTQASQLPASIAPSQLPDATQLQQEAKQTDQKKTTADLSLYKAYLRELHLDVFCLLFKTMSLDPEMENASNQLSIPEAEFLLTDLNLKLSHVFGAAKRTFALGRATAGKDDGFWHLDLFTAEEVASQAQRFIKPLCVHLDKISVFFKSLISDHDGVLDCSGVLNERTLPVARVQGLLLTSLRHLLAWPQLYRHQQLYTNMLRLICRKQWPTRTPEEVQELPTDQLLWGAFCYARQQTQALLEMGSAVLVVRLLEAIVGLARHLHHQSAPPQTEADEETEEDPEQGETCNSYGHKLGLVISTLLRRRWTSAAEGLPDRGSQYNQRVSALLQCWMKHSPRPLTVISLLTNTGLEEYNSCDTREPISDTFPSFNKGTLVIYMSCMQGNLSHSVKKALAATTSTDSSPRATPEENAANLTVWSAGVEIYSKLCRVIKQHHSRHLLSACLKYARPFLELFLSRGMPVLDLCLQSHRDEVCKLLKTLQSATRVLQIVCTESKVKKDICLTSYVPLTRRSLATLVFRVKAMLVHHNCPQAFWLGVLKNKNLDGDLIATQADNDDVPRRRSSEAEDKQDEPMAAEEDSNSRGGGDDEESDSVEGLDLEDDDRSDVELDDDTSNDSSKAVRGRKRKSVMESDDDEDNEPLEAATDYSASF